MLCGENEKGSGRGPAIHKKLREHRQECLCHKEKKQVLRELCSLRMTVESMSGTSCSNEKGTR